MKKVFLFMVCLVCMAVTIFPDTPVRNWTYMPVFMSRDVLDNSVQFVPGARDMIVTGKIYCRASCIYINERYKGVHVINNSDPAHPVNEGFILAPGCIDMAVKGNVLYIDNAVDLVSFDLESKQVTKRIRNVFPEPLPPDDFSYVPGNRPDDYVLVEWKIVNR